MGDVEQKQTIEVDFNWISVKKTLQYLSIKRYRRGIFDLKEEGSYLNSSKFFDEKVQESKEPGSGFKCFLERA